MEKNRMLALTERVIGGKITRYQVQRKYRLKRG